ncbi:response regulator [Paenibacillus sp. GCM10027626]|uniref:response regulator n=1 Tax=Paenibacillus sp. GCM10027626 TaxID=3273411 RepID=UPI00362762E7
MQETINVLVVDDMEAHQRRLQRIIAACADMNCAGTASSGTEAVAQAEALRPDIILMDIEMEDKLAGVEAAKAIHERYPDTKIIVVTVHKDDNIIFAAFQTGIIDYVLKSAEAAEIEEAIRLAAADRSPIRPMIAHKIREEFARIKKTESSLLYTIQMIAGLTPSELQVLKLLCEFKTRRQIAEERIVEYETVKKQIHSILKKFNMSSTVDVVRMVNEAKIFDVLNKL